MRPEILMHPQIPKPLHGLNPRSILGDQWWDEQRQIAYAKEDYHCMACGVHKSQAKYHHWLEAHECYRIDYEQGTAEMVEIVALCHACHNFIHQGKLLMDWKAGRITDLRYLEILAHGDQILSACKVKENPYIVDPFQKKTAPWDQWVLILNGKRYASKFKDFKAWREHYAG